MIRVCRRTTTNFLVRNHLRHCFVESFLLEIELKINKLDSQVCLDTLGLHTELAMDALWSTLSPSTLMQIVCANA